MITHLHIHNYAIIQEMDIDLARGLNIITGETGAGKSILLGATGLILGNRADTKAQFNKGEKTVVEGVFEIPKADFEEFFREQDLDFEPETIIRREINASGKSRAFINDTPVTLKTLQELSNQLVDLHQQFDTLEMQEERFQLRALDALAGHGKLLGAYRNDYLQYRRITALLEQKKQEEADAIREKDFLRFQLDEFEKIDLQPGELKELENEQALLEHSEKMTEVLGQAIFLVDEGEQPVTSALKEVLTRIRNIKSGVRIFDDLGTELDRITIDLEEWSRNAQKLADQMERNPHRLDEVRSRLDSVYQLMRKHQAVDDAELFQVLDKIRKKLKAIGSLGAEIEELEMKRSGLEASLEITSRKLTDQRKEVAKQFEKEVLKLLAELHMGNARLEVSINPSENYLPTGKDKVEFLFSANKGGTLLPIRKVASGGELSRLSLCIKSVVAGKMELPTLIFDEIDAGISGEVAHKMGLIIQSLAEKHQIIMITHSPQIASKATTHFFVRKKELEDKTVAVIDLLENRERVNEIAKMLSGDPPTDAAIQNARELLKL